MSDVSDTGTVIAFLVLYYVVVLAIGYWAMGRGAGDDLEGYLLGGRKEKGPLLPAAATTTIPLAQAASTARFIGSTK